ncbi:TetR/AcrR family transcriptional regulator [Streptomyces sp. NPDC047002]|uniref:TetR/AcrR family transcriptional regulator n=1 Tax=Streptomyces sp. NPDC047002 TaxID=3155475 RepID=UPI00345639B1
MEQDRAPVRRAKNPKGSGSRLRQEIIDAAGELLSELSGGKGLTVRGLARGVGVAPSALYQHFRDLDDVVQAVVDDDYRRLAAAMRTAASAVPEDDPVGRARALLHAYCDFAMANPSHYRLLFEHRRLTPDDAGLYPGGPLAEVIDDVVDAFARCAEAGSPLVAPPGRAGVMVFVAVHGRVSLFHATRRAKRPEDVHAFVDETVGVFLGLAR